MRNFLQKLIKKVRGMSGYEHPNDHRFSSEDPADWICWANDGAREARSRMLTCNWCKTILVHLVYEPYCSLECREDHFNGQGAGDIRRRKLPSYNSDTGFYEY